MKILYTRVSTIDQKSDRQKVGEKDYDIVVEDKCSGTIPFFDRNGGKEIQKYIDNGIQLTISAWSIDRLGRDLRDIINTIYYFTQKRIPIIFISQGLRTIDEDGNENAISKLMISILGTVSEMEKKQIKERQIEGIRIAKLKGGVYTGRRAGSCEDVHGFLSKPQNKKALELIKKGYKLNEAAQLSGVHVNTMTKIRKLGLVNQK